MKTWKRLRNSIISLPQFSLVKFFLRSLSLLAESRERKALPTVEEDQIRDSVTYTRFINKVKVLLSLIRKQEGSSLAS